MNKQRNSFASGFASQSTMVAKQTNHQEMAKMRRREQEQLILEVRQRKSMESLKKQQMEEAMMMELNKKRAMVHFGNARVKGTYISRLCNI
jgi:hypothetical protein